MDRIPTMLPYLRRRTFAAVAGLVAALSFAAPGTAWTATSADPEARPLVEVVLIDAFPPQFYIYSFTPLLDYLRAKLPQYRFQVLELPAAVVESDGLPPLATPNAFFLLSSGAAALRRDWRLQQIATRRAVGRKPSEAVSALYIVKAESPYQTLADLEGHTVAASTRTSFQHWLVPMGELEQLGFDSSRFFSNAVFAEWDYPDVPMLVSLGAADVGILGVCELEAGLADGRIEPGAFRIINEKTQPGDACRRSTALYPDMMLAALPSADADIVKAVSIAILSMPPIQGYDWASNADDGRVDGILHALKLGPYAYLKDWSAAGIWRRFRYEILAVFAFLVLLVVHVVRADLLVKRRTEELAREAALREKAASELEESRRKLEQMERAGMAVMLSAMFAHEIKQPLTNIVNFLAGVRMLRKGRSAAGGEKEGERALDAAAAAESRALRRAEEEAHRAAAIVERVRSAVKSPRVEKKFVALRAVVQEAAFHSQAAKLDPQPVLLLPVQEVWARGNALELQLVIVNFLNNAAYAVREQSRPKVTVDLQADESAGEARISVIDSGEPLSEEAFSHLGRIAESAKPDGLGFGLAIAASIAEAHGGRLAFHRVAPQGLCAVLILPLAEPQGDS